MDMRSDYRVLENNCQHFAKALIRDITGNDCGPRTIAEMLHPFIVFAENARNLARLRTNPMHLSPTSESTFLNMLGKTILGFWAIVNFVYRSFGNPRESSIVFS